MKITPLVLLLLLPRAAAQDTTLPPGVECEGAIPLALDDSNPMPVSFSDAIRPQDSSGMSMEKMVTELGTCKYNEGEQQWWAPLDNPSVWFQFDGTGQGVRLDICGTRAGDAQSLAANVYAQTFGSDYCIGLECVAISNPNWRSTNCPTGAEGLYMTFPTSTNSSYKVLLTARRAQDDDLVDVTIQATSLDYFVDNAYCSKATPVQLNQDITGSLAFEQAGQVVVAEKCHGVSYVSGFAPVETHGQWYVVNGTGETLHLIEPSIGCNPNALASGSFSVYLFKGGFLSDNNYYCEGLASDRRLQCTGPEIFLDIDVCGGVERSRGYTWKSEGGYTYYILVQYEPQEEGTFILHIRSASMKVPFGSVLYVGAMLSLVLTLF